MQDLHTSVRMNNSLSQSSATVMKLSNWKKRILYICVCVCEKVWAIVSLTMSLEKRHLIIVPISSWLDLGPQPLPADHCRLCWYSYKPPQTPLTPTAVIISYPLDNFFKICTLMLITASKYKKNRHAVNLPAFTPRNQAELSKLDLGEQTSSVKRNLYAQMREMVLECV